MDLVARAAAPAFHTLDVTKARDEVRKMLTYFSPEPPAVAEVRDLRIASDAGAGEIAARLYRPLGSAADERIPVLIFFHGGGWIAGDLDGYDSLCRVLANKAGCAVLSVQLSAGARASVPRGGGRCECRAVLGAATRRRTRS